MSSFTDRYGREALALLQLDSAAREPLVGDDFPTMVSDLGPADGLAALLSAEDYGSEAEDAYWRELHLHQLAEGGGCDYDEVDPSNWIHRSPTPGDVDRAAGSPAERLQSDFDRIVGRLR